MTPHELAAMRAEYLGESLTEDAAGDDPFELFDRWLDEAVAAGIGEPNAMALATATSAGQPSVRIVLLKSFDQTGAVFHTNYESRKGVEIDANPRVAAVLLWHDIRRQVRIEGPITRVSAEESDAYFATRPPGGRVSAAASPQSQIVADRAELEQRWAAASAADDSGQRPVNWGGYRIAVDHIEFWQGRENRLHDRLLFSRAHRDAAWARVRLAP